MFTNGWSIVKTLLLILLLAGLAYWFFQPKKTEVFNLSGIGVDCSANVYEHFDGSTSFKFNCKE